MSGWDRGGQRVVVHDAVAEMHNAMVRGVNGDDWQADHVEFLRGGWVKVESDGTTQMYPPGEIRSVHVEVTEAK